MELNAAMRLTAHEQSMLDGEHGPATQLALGMVIALGQMVGAERLLPVTSAHIDSCLFHGQAGLDFARRLADDGGQVVVPTTLNVSSLDLRHPDLVRLPTDEHRDARALMDAYTAMGCRPTWTCAPYQLSDRPSFGEHVAWAESNAIVFANSMLGARTERYGDFIDICAALTGRVPLSGLHLDEARRGEVVFDVHGLPYALLADPVVFPLVGHVVGGRTGTKIPVIVGLPATATEDDGKALGAAAASSGGVALFHAVGITPEAPTLDAALHGLPALETIVVTAAMLQAARNDLTTTTTTTLAAVSVGTPHFSVAEFQRLAALMDAAGAPSQVPFYVSTGRDVWDAVEALGLGETLLAAGVQVVTDTCTYVTPILDVGPGAVLTNSAKWAYYAPGNIGVDAVFASLGECVMSAVAGRVVLDPQLGAVLGGEA
jgi:predicted aconitase